MVKKWSLLLTILTVLAGLVPLTTQVSSVQAQSGVTWTVQFYNNIYLLNPVAATATATTIATDWGEGAPWAGVNADNWSARFSSNPFFNAGNYRFTITADDGVQLHVDGNQLLTSFNQNKAGQTLTVDVTLSQGNHTVQVDFQELGGKAYIYVSWTNLSAGGTTVVGTGSCSAQFYNNPLLSGSPAVVTNQPSPANNWGGGAPIAGIGADNFSVRWTCPQTLQGTYNISAKADDGIRVYVNGVNYIDKWGAATGQTHTASFSIPLGTYNVVVEYFEQTGNAFVEFALNQVSGGGTGIWSTQYYNNSSLSGNPVVIINETDPTHNWGTGAPLSGLPADSFSARWTSSQTLNAGNYQIRVRADDGVRVYVNGNIAINEWHDATLQYYTNTVTLGSGTHTIVVEYYEAFGAALLEYSLVQVNTPAPTTPTGTTGTATINTGRLNVRNAPNRFTGQVVVRVNQGESYPIVGRNQDSSWWQINVNGTVGWVNANYVLASNTSGVSVVSTGTQDLPAATGYTLTTKVRVNMRSAPSFSGVIVNVLTPNGIAQIVGRSADNRWWKVIFGDIVGWVNGDYILLQQQVDYNKVPVAAQ